MPHLPHPSAELDDARMTANAVETRASMRLTQSAVLARRQHNEDFNF
jgi:hypothetical protein